MTNIERMAMKGRLMQMKETQYAITVEMAALAQGLHAKAPVVDGLLYRVSDMDIPAAKALLDRMAVLKAQYDENAQVMDAIQKELS